MFLFHQFLMEVWDEHFLLKCVFSFIMTSGLRQSITEHHAQMKSLCKKTAAACEIRENAFITDEQQSALKSGG